MKTKFIADVGSNFDGSLDTAKKYIDIAKKIGIDTVKFQTWTADTLVAPSHPAFQLLKEKTYGLPLEWHRELFEYAESKGVEFLTTPTQPEHVEFLEKLGVQRYKIASGDLTFAPLLKAIAETGKPVIVSTGMAYCHEVEEALSYFSSRTPIVLLHCVSRYPPEWDEMNLRVITDLKHVSYNIEVGLSDHSPGYTAAVVAVALGATCIEKHITLSKELSTPDAPFALTTGEFKELTEQVRLTEKMLGSGRKIPAPNEIPERFWARRGVYARRDLPEGVTISSSDLICLRPAKGVEASQVWQLEGKRLKTPVSQGEPIFWDMVE